MLLSVMQQSLARAVCRMKHDCIFEKFGEYLYSTVVMPVCASHCLSLFRSCLRSISLKESILLFRQF